MACELKLIAVSYKFPLAITVEVTSGSLVEQLILTLDLQDGKGSVIELGRVESITDNPQDVKYSDVKLKTNINLKNGKKVKKLVKGLKTGIVYQITGTESVPDVQPAAQTPLRAYDGTLELLLYLDGYLARQAQLQFEAGMSPWIQQQMRKAFPVDSAEYSRYMAEQKVKEIEEKKVNWKEKMQELVCEIKKLELAMKTCPNSEKQPTKQQIKVKQTELGALHMREDTLEHYKGKFFLDNEQVHISVVKGMNRTEVLKLNNIPEFPKAYKLWNLVEQHQAKQNEVKKALQPAWVMKSREVFGSSMQVYITEKRWDTYTICKVMAGYINDVVVPNRFTTTNNSENSTPAVVTTALEAEKMMQDMLQAAYSRTIRAHGDRPMASEVIEFMRRMHLTMQYCVGGNTPEAQAIAQLLQQADDLLKEARNADAARKYESKTTPVLHEKHIPDMKRSDLRAAILYDVFRVFHAKLDDAVGFFRYGNQTIEVPDSKNWDKAHKQKITGLRNKFQYIASMRHWLFHNTGSDLSVDFALKSMNSVIHSVAGIKVYRAQRQAELEKAASKKPQQIGEQRVVIEHNAVTEQLPELPMGDSATLSIRMNLTVPPQRMRIPIQRDQMLVGRDKEIKQVTDLLLAKQGARVLIHGAQGVGKDVLAVEVIRSSSVRQKQGLKLQAWLHGSTHSIFSNGIINLFETHLSHVLAPARDVKDKLDTVMAFRCIKKWLTENAEWLLVVQDVTESCVALLECIPSGDARTGHLLMTSQQPPVTAVLESKATQSALSMCSDADQSLELLDLTPLQCIQLLRKMGIFSARARNNYKQAGAKPSEADMKARCDATSGSVVYVGPPDAARPATEVSSAKTTRHVGMLTKLCEYEELDVKRERTVAFLRDSLGCSPLAVAMLGHSIRESQSLLNKTIQRFTVDHVDSKGVNPQNVKRVNGIKMTCRIAVERLVNAVTTDTDMSAVSLLVCMSLLHYTQTPESLFTQNEASESDSGGVFHDVQLFYKSREHLIRFGFLKQTVSTMGETVMVGNMHQLVQRTIRELVVDGSDKKFQCCGLAAKKALSQVLLSQYQFDPRARTVVEDDKSVQRLSPAVNQWYSLHNKQTGQEDDANVFRLSETELELRSVQGQVMIWRGQYEKARVIHKDVLDIRKQKLGARHKATVRSMGSLAVTLCKLGEHKEALAMQKAVVKIQKEELGSQHLDTLRSINNLVITLGELGELKKAVAMQEAVLEIQKVSSLGDALTSMNNLASHWARWGKHRKALVIYEAVLQIQKDVLGPKHPDTLTSRNNLAASLYELGEYKEARVIYEGVLKIQKEELVLDHRDTLKSISNLACILRELGQYQAALVIYEYVLEIRKQALGPKHPDILNSMSELAATLIEHEEGLVIEKDVLEFLKLVLGADYLDTLTSMNNLASILGILGEHNKTLAMQKYKLEIPNPATLNSINNLASIVGRLGQHQAALVISEHVLKIRKQALRPDHPDILLSMSNLAYIHGLLGQHKEALVIQEEALVIQEDALKIQNQGLLQRHPHTLSSKSNLAYIHGRMGQHEEARVMHEDVLEIRETVLGPEHPDTLTSMNCLADTLLKLGIMDRKLVHVNKAVELYTSLLSIRETAKQKSVVDIGKTRRDLTEAKEEYDRLWNDMGPIRRRMWEKLLDRKKLKAAAESRTNTAIVDDSKTQSVSPAALIGGQQRSTSNKAKTKKTRKKKGGAGKKKKGRRR